MVVQCEFMGCEEDASHSILVPIGTPLEPGDPRHGTQSDHRRLTVAGFCEMHWLTVLTMAGMPVA